MEKAFLSVSISVDVCSQPQCFSHSNGVSISVSLIFDILFPGRKFESCKNRLIESGNIGRIIQNCNDKMLRITM
jgi:hypothetical protein